MLHKLLSQIPDMQMHHEYMVHIHQPLAVKYYQGLINKRQVAGVLQSTYGSAVAYADTPFWGDSSNKASWYIDVLSDIFPQARFVHLVRDGRKVASSYLHKLGDEIYDDQSTAALSSYVSAPSRVTAPPPEKKYWWPVPNKNHPDAELFHNFDQFERIAWHWAEVNRVAATVLGDMPRYRWTRVALEDLVSQRSVFDRLMDFLELRPQEDLFPLLKRPHNVNQPVDTPLTDQQADQFDAIAGPMMELLGYAEQPEYAVNY